MIQADYLSKYLYINYISNIRIESFINIGENKDNKILNLHANVKEYNDFIENFLINKPQKLKNNEQEEENWNEGINKIEKNKKNLKDLNNFLLNLIERHSNLNDNLDIFIEKLENK